MQEGRQIATFSPFLLILTSSFVHPPSIHHKYAALYRSISPLHISESLISPAKATHMRADRQNALSTLFLPPPLTSNDWARHMLPGMLHLTSPHSSVYLYRSMCVKVLNVAKLMTPLSDLILHWLWLTQHFILRISLITVTWGCPERS